MSNASANDDEALSALIDGSLPAEQAAALHARLERDPALAARLVAMERANRAVRDAYRGVVDEPLPERVLELLSERRSGDAEVVELAGRRRRRAWLPLPQAVAAGIALVVGLGLGFGLGQRSAVPDASGLLAATGTVAPGSSLAELLESLPSGRIQRLDGAATAEARLTFRAVDGGWCRELAATSATASNAAVACRRDGAWRIELVGVAAAGGELYRPAGVADAPFAEAVDALIDGEPLEAEAERALLARGWTDE